MVGDEARSIEVLPPAGAWFEPRAIRRHHRDHVGDRVALHGPPPGISGVERGVVRLRADGGRIEQHLGAAEHHGAGGLRVPLVPADADAEPAEAGVPDLEAGVAGPEVVLLLVAGAVGDVALAVDPQRRAVGVDHHQAVVVVRPLPLEDRDRQHHPQLLGQRRQTDHAGVLAPGIGGLEPALLLTDAEVWPLEQLWRQDRLGPPARGLAHQPGDAGDVGLHVLAEGRLDGRDGDRPGHAGSCWVMQWKDPPPVRMARDGRPIT